MAKKRRNAPCACGSGRKFKHCHGAITHAAPSPSAIAAVVAVARSEMALREQQATKYRAIHGHGKRIMSVELEDWRVVMVGNELHTTPRDTTKFFPDFLSKYLKGLLGPEWYLSERDKLPAERHQIIGWYLSLCEHEQKTARDADGIWRHDPSGAMLSWYRLAYDLFLIKHNAALQRRILMRLRDRQQFQGARFELVACATMIVAGYTIAFENEEDNSRKHPEFLATGASGLVLAVEAKSRHRLGVLGHSMGGTKAETDISGEGLIRDAIAKDPANPYVVFVDTNLPRATDELWSGTWFDAMLATVRTIQSEWEPRTFPASAFVFYGDPTYRELDRTYSGDSLWCYVLPIDHCRQPLPRRELAEVIGRALIQRATFPNEFPDVPGESK